MEHTSAVQLIIEYYNCWEASFSFLGMKAIRNHRSGVECKAILVVWIQSVIQYQTNITELFDGGR